MPGRHIYPFECTLPPDLPSSFNSNFGHISYTVIGTIERPWKFDHKTIDVFKVVSNYDLNSDPKALVSFENDFLLIHKLKFITICVSVLNYF